MEQREVSPNLTRRTFLSLLTAETTLITSMACSPNLPFLNQGPQPPRRLRDGQWSSDEIIQLATEMMIDTDLNDVAFTGNLLLQNQAGKPSFSTLSPFFTDDKVTFETVNKISTENPLGPDAPLAATISEITPYVPVTMHPKVNGQQITFKGPPKLRMERILINRTLTADVSDFLIRFFVAKEVFNVKAFDDFVEYAATDAWVDYNLPSDLPGRNAAKLKLLQGSIGQMPAYAMADLWAHYYLVPNFNVAKDKGLFSESELNHDALRLFQLATESFQKAGLLQDRTGNYQWNIDNPNFFEEWWNFSMIGYHFLHE